MIIKNKPILGLILFSLFLVTIPFVTRFNKNLINNHRGEKYQELSISGGVVPHHLLAEDIIDSFFQYISKENIENIVILSPDHFNASVLTSSSFISIGSENETLLDYPISKTMLDRVGNQNFAYNTSAVSSDHGIRNLIPFIKKYLPKSKILPLLISSRTTADEMNELIRIFAKNSETNTIVIASVDFSHYLPRNVAEFHDAKSASTLIDFKKDDFTGLEVDSWQALYGARLFAMLKNIKNFHIIGKGGSWDYVNDELSEKSDETTSYFSVVFQDADQNFEMEKGKTILFTGGIILDRNVEKLIEENSMLYPFQKIERLLRGVDVVVGNLEESAMQGSVDFTDDSPNFNFMSEIAEGLSWSHFNLLSLGNNQSFLRTKKVLDKWNIEYVGNPTTCGEESIVEYKGITFLSFNTASKQSCSETEISALVSETKTTKPDSYIVTIINWSDEHNSSSSTKQRFLAHKIIDAGSDMIIGQNPLATQEIEVYKNKPIFYSLSNFINSQHSTKETQEGLIVGVELYENHIKYNIFPIKISQSQPFLLTELEKTDFLKTLVGRNDTTLYNNLENGTLNVKR